MKYQLIDDYFDSKIFGETVQNYFDTVLSALFADHTLTETKGRFVVNGIEKMDYYDMPYPIHILNGLIPTLKIYEKYLQSKALLDHNDTKTLLKVFMLGFTLHDANKLMPIVEQAGKADLEIAIEKLRDEVKKFRAMDFFSDFDKWQNEIFFLALGTENRTQVLANQYPLRQNEKFIREILRPLCHLADSLASIQELDSPSSVHESIVRKLKQAESIFENISISYLGVRPNPYSLTSQHLLQSARKVLAKNGKSVCFALRDGFVFFGEDITTDERKLIKSASAAHDFDPIELTKVDYQQCDFGFIGSMPFSEEVLNQIEDEMHNRFLALSPNSPEKIQEFEKFVEFLKKFLSAFSPVDQFISPVVDEKTNKLYLRFAKVDSDEGVTFRKLVCLQKIQWLNGKNNKAWADDFEQWMQYGKYQTSKNEAANLTILPSSFKVDGQEFISLTDVANFVGSVTSTPSPILKTLFVIAKSWYALFSDEPDPEGTIKRLQKETIETFQSPGNIIKADYSFYDTYFYYKGELETPLKGYIPAINTKSEMCLFSGGKAEKNYSDTTAFGVKAKGFSNRTVTTLGNTQSKISYLFEKENKLRKSKFPQSDANFCLYTDYFETSLDISRDIITAAAKAKSLQFIEDNIIEIDKNAKFQYNLFNMDFVALKPEVGKTFYQVRKWLLIVKELGLRVYVTGIMSPYLPHKDAFHFENAPTVIKAIGWHSIRLNEVEQVLSEMNLLISFGPKRIDANLLQVSTSRRSYFKLYYMLSQDDKKKVQRTLSDFVTRNHLNLFPEMTIIQQLVERALLIEKAAYNSSGAQETWLIRTALDYLRSYTKQEYPREDVISKISGEIYRRMRHEPVQNKINTIENFATAVYDLLYVETWKEQLPNTNVQKDWIYEFAFVFKKQSMEWFDLNKKGQASKPDNMENE